MRFKTIGSIILSAFLAACGGGGGGGEALYVNASYPPMLLNLFANVRIEANLSGFEGHTPNCSLVSGTIASGVTVNPDCTITGRPLQAGDHEFSIRVGVAGSSDTVLVSASMRVAAPSVTYSLSTLQDSYGVGVAVNDAPRISGWAPADDVDAMWTYALRSGSLPTGLTLNPSTGAVSGVTLGAGSFTADIQAVLTTAYGTYEPALSTYAANVATFIYSNAGGTGFNNGYLRAYISQPFLALPLLDAAVPAGTTLSAFSLNGAVLPVGLTLDPALGAISGSPTTAAAGVVIPVAATITSGALSNPTQTNFAIEVAYPLSITYGGGTLGTVGSPITKTPQLVQVSPIAPVAHSVGVFTPRPGSCSLPPGMTFNTATGVASGTPTAAGAYSCTVDVPITNNGVSWSQEAQIIIAVN